MNRFDKEGYIHFDHTLGLQPLSDPEERLIGLWYFERDFSVVPPSK